MEGVGVGRGAGAAVMGGWVGGWPLVGSNKEGNFGVGASSCQEEDSGGRLEPTLHTSDTTHSRQETPFFLPLPTNPDPLQIDGRKPTLLPSASHPSLCVPIRPCRWAVIALLLLNDTPPLGSTTAGLSGFNQGLL